MKLTQTDKGTYLIDVKLEITEETKELLKNNRTLAKYFSDEFLNKENEIEESLNNKLQALIKFILNNRLFTNERIVNYLDDCIEKEKAEKNFKKEIENFKMITDEVLRLKKEEEQNPNNSDYIKAFYQILRVQYDTYLILKQSLLKSNSLTKDEADKSLEVSQSLSYNALAELYKDNENIKSKLNEIANKSEEEG